MEYKTTDDRYLQQFKIHLKSVKSTYNVSIT